MSSHARRRWFAAVMVPAAIAAMAMTIACGRGAPADDEHKEGAHEGEHEEGPAVVELSEAAMTKAGLDIQPVRRVSPSQLVLAPAELQINADRVAEVGPRVAGRVARVHASMGAHVRQGDPLAVVQSPAIGEAAAALQTAHASADVARKTLTRERDLFTRRISAEREVLEAEAEVARAEAAVRSAESRLRAIGVEPAALPADGNLTLRAPIAGTIIERTVAVDAPVNPDSVLFTIADLTSLWLVVHVPESGVAAIRRGQTVSVAIDALPDRRVAGKVEYIAPIVTPDTRTVAVRLHVPNGDGTLRPGMTARAQFDVAARQATTEDARLLIPQSAVQDLEQATVAFVPVGERKFEARRIALGSTYGPDVEVLSGLQAGDRIVVRGAFTLKSQALRGEAAHDDH